MTLGSAQTLALSSSSGKPRLAHECAEKAYPGRVLTGDDLKKASRWSHDRDPDVRLVEG
jgi:hypothetical protein